MLPFAFLKTIHFHFYFIKKLKYYLSVMLRKRKTMQKHFPYFIFTYSYTGVHVNLWKTKYMLTASCCIWINYKTSGTMSFGKTRAKWRRLAPPNTVYQHKHRIATVKHNGGGVILCAFCTATGPWHLAAIESTMNSKYQSILESNMRESFQQLKLGPNWITLQDDDPKHTSKSEKEESRGVAH